MVLSKLDIKSITYRLIIFFQIYEISSNLVRNQSEVTNFDPRRGSGGLQGACGWPEGPPKSWSDSGIHFPRKYANILQLYTVWEPPGVQNRIKRIHRIQRIHRMKAKWYTTGSTDPRFLTRLRSG